MQTSQNRAAIICLGGWGLQVMLQLNPRLLDIQRQRRFLGTHYDLPNLNDITKVVTFVPTPTTKIDGDGNTFSPFRVFIPSEGITPSIAELEKLSNVQINRSNDRHIMSHVEEVTENLIKHALHPDRRWMRHITNDPRLRFEFTPSNPDRITRQEYFSLMNEAASDLSSFIKTEIIDPTKQDNLSPTDMYVQTSIYVVASLTEPLSSAMLWPLISELKNTLGTGQLVRIVGIFNLGSFADDSNKPFEEACAHVALTELEAFSGVNPTTELASSYQALSQYISTNRKSSESKIKNLQVPTNKFQELIHNLLRKRELVLRTKTQVFDHIYFVDREKENLAHAANLAELATIVTNILETFVTSEIPQVIDQSLYIDKESRPQYAYNSVGSYSRYIPLMRYMEAGIQQQRMKLIQLVTHGENGVHEQSSTEHLLTLDTVEFNIQHIYEPLQRLTTTKDALFERIVEPNIMMQLWTRFINRFWPSSDHQIHEHLPSLEVSYRYYTRQLNLDYRQPLHLMRTAVLHQQEIITRQIQRDIQTDTIERIWGTHYNQIEVFDTVMRAEAFLQSLQTSFINRASEVNALLPQAIARTIKKISQIIQSGPSGLNIAFNALTSISLTVQNITRRYSNDNAKMNDSLVESDMQMRTAQQNWDDRDFVRYNQQQLTTSQIIRQAVIMAILTTLVCGVFLVHYSLTNEITWNYIAFTYILGLSVPTFLWLIIIVVQPLIARRLIKKLININLRHTNEYATSIIHIGVVRLYDRYLQSISDLQKIVDDTRLELKKHLTEDMTEERINHELTHTHVREVIKNSTLWHDVMEFMNKQARGDNKSNQQAFRESWAQDSSYSEIKQPFNLLVIERTLELLTNLGMVESAIHAETIKRTFGKDVFNYMLPTDYQNDPQFITNLTIVQQEIYDTWCPFGTPESVANGIPNSCSTCVTQCALHKFNSLRQHSNAEEVTNIINLIMTLIQRRKHGLIVSSLLSENNIADGIIGHLDRTLSYLQQKEGDVPRDQSFVQHILTNYTLAQLVANTLSPQKNIHQEIDRIARLAKTAVVHDTIDNQPMIENQYVVYDQVDASIFAQPFMRRGFDLFDGGDPFSINVVRIVHTLRKLDMPPIVRNYTEYLSIHQNDRKWIELAQLSSLYGYTDGTSRSKLSQLLIDMKSGKS
jgi:hypothetical protein